MGKMDEFQASVCMNSYQIQKGSGFMDVQEAYEYCKRMHCGDWQNSKDCHSCKRCAPLCLHVGTACLSVTALGLNQVQVCEPVVHSMVLVTLVLFYLFSSFRMIYQRSNSCP